MIEKSAQCFYRIACLKKLVRNSFLRRSDYTGEARRPAGPDVRRCAMIFQRRSLAGLLFFRVFLRGWRERREQTRNAEASTLFLFICSYDHGRQSHVMTAVGDLKVTHFCIACGLCCGRLGAPPSVALQNGVLNSVERSTTWTQH